MHIISSLLFALSANIDSFVIGMSYGIQKVRIPIPQGIIISIVTLIGTASSIGIGMQLVPFLPNFAAQVAGSSILIALGIYFIIKYILRTHRAHHSSDKISANELTDEALLAPTDDPLVLPWREAVLLGAALSLNNIGMGIGASITGIGIAATSISTFFISTLFLYLGNHMGKVRVLGFANKWADPLSGLLLIGLGVYEIFV